MNAQIYEEASEWIVINRDGNLDARSRSRFDAWLRRSPEHVQAYLEMSSIWETLPEIRSGTGPSTEAMTAEIRRPSSAVVALHEFDKRRPEYGDASRDAPSEPVTRTSLTYLLPVAASLLAAVAGAWLYAARGTYETDVGEQRSVVLDDGSRMELNSRTRVRVRYTDGERCIELLEGQALFDVARDALRPFVVKSGAAHVRAVGTQFDVYRRPEGTVVTVVEGEVAVVPPPVRGSLEPVRRGGSPRPEDAPRTSSNEVLIGAGEQVTVRRSASPQPVRADIEAATAWTRRMLVFDAASLTEVAAQFNRYNQRQIVIMGPIRDAISVSGTFSASDPEVLLRFLAGQPELRVQAIDDEIHISSQ